MSVSTAHAGILLLLTSVIAYINPVFAQSGKTASQQPGFHFDFENVTKRMAGLSDISLPDDEQDSVIDKFGKRLVDDLKNTTGYIDMGYSYGLNTIFIDTTRSIGSIFNTSGAFSTGLLGLPVNVSFNYSTLRVPLGANNYFRISLDKEKLIEEQKEKMTASIEQIENQQATLNKKQAELSGLMGYVEVYLDKLKRMAERELKERKEGLLNRSRDSLSLKIKQDSLNYSVSTIPDSPGTINYQRPDLTNPVDYQLYYDSIMSIYQRISSLKNAYDSLYSQLESSKQLVNSYKKKLNSPPIGGKGLKKAPFLESIKTFDIGLTYPKTTGLSSQNVPIKGLHTEIQRDNLYISIASGLTLNNLMLSTNELDNQLNYNQNVFNNFDFQRILNNGWLTTLKTGYGTPEGTHAFIGFNYLTNTRFLSPAGQATAQPAYNPAAAIELNLRYIPTFYKGGIIDLVYGKTSLNRQLDTVTQAGVFESLFSGYTSNVLLTKYTQAAAAIRSDFSLAYRRMDAYANTTSYGMMQPNNQRVEFNSNHRLAKFMKLGLLYRMDETLRALTGMNHLRLHMTGATISGNHTSYFNYSFFLNHVHHTMHLSDGAGTQRGNNYLLGLNLSSNYEAGKLKANSMVTYNDYLISDTSGMNKFTQFGVVQSFGEQQYTVSASYDYFFRRMDGLSTGTSIFGMMGKYAFDRAKIGAGMKIASDFAGTSSIGGHLEAIWEAYRFLAVSLRAERFVMGDLYRNYYRSQYERFPYLITIQTHFKIQ